MLESGIRTYTVPNWFNLIRIYLVGLADEGSIIPVEQVEDEQHKAFQPVKKEEPEDKYELGKM